VKLAYEAIDIMTLIIYVVGGHVEDGVRIKLPRGVRHGTAVQLVHDVIAAANKAMEGQ
jgi:hypothetical protein